MWLFTTKGFVSIVADTADKNFFWVRSRFAGDIEKLFPNAEVVRTPQRDYLYRAKLPHLEVSNRIAEEVGNISYPNFKNAVPTKKRQNIYNMVWMRMYMEGDNPYPPKHQRRKGITSWSRNSTKSSALGEVVLPAPVK
jgi:hypothetical protein